MCSLRGPGETPLATGDAACPTLISGVVRVVSAMARLVEGNVM